MTDLNVHPAGHETDTGDVRLVSITALVLAGSLGLILLLILGVFTYLARRPVTDRYGNPMAQNGRDQFPPEPRIEEHPEMELKRLREREDRLLSTYGWTDRKAGIVRIPIDRAMELQLQRGFPVRGASK